MATLGIDLGGADIKSIALSSDGTVLWRDQIPSGAAMGRAFVLGRLVNIVQRGRQALSPERIESAGFAIPGVLDAEGEVVELLTNFTPEWNGFNVRRALEVEAGIPVSLLNDARAATLGESLFGAGRPFRHFVNVVVGTGIGGGLVLDGRLYRGGRGAAGEVGHQTMQPGGPRCNCGNRGCLEALASGRAIRRDAMQAIEAGDRELAAIAGSDSPSPEGVAAAARRGNETARHIYEQAGLWIGRALGNVVCLLNPDAIVIGGGVSAAGDLLLDPIRRELAARTVVFSPARGGAPVLLSPLYNDAGAMGAAAWSVRQSEG